MNLLSPLTSERIDISHLVMDVFADAVTALGLVTVNA
jgi:hypothetical protein